MTTRSNTTQATLTSVPIGSDIPAASRAMPTTAAMTSSTDDHNLRADQAPAGAARLAVLRA